MDVASLVFGNFAFWTCYFKLLMLDLTYLKICLLDFWLHCTIKFFPLFLWFFQFFTPTFWFSVIDVVIYYPETYPISAPLLLKLHLLVDLTTGLRLFHCSVFGGIKWFLIFFIAWQPPTILLFIATESDFIFASVPIHKRKLCFSLSTWKWTLSSRIVCMNPCTPTSPAPAMTVGVAT